MSNVMFALRRTTTDALSSVSAAAGAITHSATAVSDLAATGAAHARAYREDTEITLRQDSTRRRTRRVHQLAIEDAQFYLDLESQLGNDNRLKELYQATIKEYNSVQPQAIEAD